MRRNGMIRRNGLIGLVCLAVVVLLSSGALAASRYLITNTRQIKPSVLRKIETRIFAAAAAGKSVTMCAASSGAPGPCEIGASDARCPSGGFVTGGGFDGGSNPPVFATVGYSEPDNDGHGWHVVMTNLDSQSASFQAVADCELVVGGSAARDVVTGVPRSVTAQVDREVASVRSALR